MNTFDAAAGTCLRKDRVITEGDFNIVSNS
jgi:hypothetical protein